jgi:DNA-binding transcriptional LysR family regulator
MMADWRPSRKSPPTARGSEWRNAAPQRTNITASCSQRLSQRGYRSAIQPASGAKINMLNVHHLELFYYVARCEGIVAACRQIPYGIQQPAVSAQVARLEEDLGARLFERRPFRLTPAGKALYDFIAPFFGRLSEVEDIVKGKMSRVIRLAGFTEAMREHVPVLLAKLRERFPGLKVTLQEINQRGAEQLIAQGDADLAIMVLESKLPPGFHSVTLARLPLCLLVPADQPYSRTADLLISLPPHELLPRLFQKELIRRNLVWRTSMETSSQDSVSNYVRNGLGAGLAVQTPDLQRDPGFRVLPLSGFPSLPIGIFWRGKLGEIAQVFVDELAERARQIFGKAESGRV